MEVEIPTPSWGVPYLQPARFKGLKGGRASGKSHFFAELLVEAMVINPDLRAVCIREVQKSLRFSAKKLIEDKIRSLGFSGLFEILQPEIRRKGGDGVILFQGMNSHNADSIKSLEGFDIAWVEEAQSLSKRSLDLLIPTIRKEGSEIWFSWNPENPDDPVEQFKEDMLLTHVNYMDNPFCPSVMIDEANRLRKLDPDAYEHIWLGGYNIKNEAQIFYGKWSVDEFEPQKSWHPLHGLDWGFSNDPTVATRFYLENGMLFIYQEAGKVGLELDETAAYIKSRIPEIDKYPIYADCARPESISLVRRPNRLGDSLPLIKPAPKWPGSVEDGIAFMKSVDRIVIHPQCKNTIDEFRLYKYKVDPKTEEVTNVIVDKHNHYIDSIRYGLTPFIKQAKEPKIRRV